MEAMRSKWTDERLDERATTVDGRFDRLEAHLDSRFAEVNARLDSLSADLNSMSRMIIGGVATLIIGQVLQGLFGG